ncbi:MAG: hypothetical protein DYG93_08930 [Leptolyngbya sp. PLA2]|nr:hypothetical protein [Leptolyngbya sp. PL-A2]
MEKEQERKTTHAPVSFGSHHVMWQRKPYGEESFLFPTLTVFVTVSSSTRRGVLHARLVEQTPPPRSHA